MVASLHRVRIEFPKYVASGSSGSGSGSGGGLTPVLLAEISARRSTNQAIPGGFSMTDISWTDEVFDDGWGWAPTAATFTVPSGVEFIVVSIATARVGAGGFEDSLLRAVLNGAVVVDRYIYGQFRAANNISIGLAVAAGDTIKFQVGYEVARSLYAVDTWITIRGYGYA